MTQRQQIRPKRLITERQDKTTQHDKRTSEELGARQLIKCKPTNIYSEQVCKSLNLEFSFFKTCYAEMLKKLLAETISTIANGKEEMDSCLS